MGYSISLVDPVSGEMLQAGEKHRIQGANYAIGGTRDMWVSVTYNYSPFFYKHIDQEKGIRFLYGKTGAETIPVLEDAISSLKDDATNRYWDATEGNAKRALCGLLAFARMRPDGVWEGD